VLLPGAYELSLSLLARNAGERCLEGMPAVYTSKHQLNVLPGSEPGLLLVDSSPRGAVVTIDGVAVAQATPCAIVTAPGLHAVTVVDPQMAPYAVTIDTSLAPATLMSVALVPLVPVPLVLTTSVPSIDVGALKAGVGITMPLQVIVTGGVVQATGVVTTSTNWIRVSPLTFTGSQQFTVGIDPRWIDPNQVNTGTIAFTLGDAVTRVSISAGFAPAPVSLVMAPQSLTVGEGDEFQLDLTVRNLQAPFDRVDLVVTWDPSVVNLLTVTPGTPLVPDGALSPEGGTLRVAGTVAGMDAEHAVLASFRFTALMPTAKTGINLRGTISLGVAQVRASFGGSALTINKHFEAPGTPASLRAAAESGAVRLTWMSATTGTYPLRRYDVYRSLGSTDLESAELIAELKPGVQQYLDRGPLERSTYTYWVMAEDEKGNVGSPAGPVGAKPIIHTETPTVITLVFTIGKPIVVMNGVIVAMEAAPVIENGRTILPVRYVATPLGAQVLWNSHDQKVTLIGTSRIELWIGKPTARVDGIDTPIDPANSSVVPRIIGGRTMLPLRFITETFGADVAFEARTGTVTVTFRSGEGQ
jgi:hypothetical protein